MGETRSYESDRFIRVTHKQEDERINFLIYDAKKWTTAQNK